MPVTDLTRGGGRLVLITVEDRGPGIPQEALPRIFDPFFTTKDVGHGSGLGLYVSQEIIHQHGGCIGVEIRPGAGTRFLIALPYDRPADAP
jgi:signal transduction histidine kinase